MTDSDPPVERFFDLQREVIRETGTFLERIVEVSAETADGLSVEHQRELATETLELARESTHGSLDAVETVTGGRAADVADTRETVDRAFDTLQDQQTQAFEAFEEQSGAFEDEATARVDEQVEALLEATEELEEQLTAAAEQFVEQADDGEVTARLEEQLDSVAEQFTTIEEQFETIEVTAPEE
jgi:hypothetical protein